MYLIKRVPGVLSICQLYHRIRGRTHKVGRTTFDGTVDAKPELQDVVVKVFSGVQVLLPCIWDGELFSSQFLCNILLIHFTFYDNTDRNFVCYTVFR